MHHKFVVIDFDKPTARVYLGSYNFSSPADIKNGENLLADPRPPRSRSPTWSRRCASSTTTTSGSAQSASKKASKPFVLRKPPREPGEVPWWKQDYTDARRIRDRELFA